MFKNEAEPKTPDMTYKNPSIGHYHYTKPSKYLFRWSRLLQAVVSQAGTYLFTKKFHDHECGIYKCEGGCRIDGKGDLVLGSDSCYWDRRAKEDDTSSQQMADLITAIVLAFDPMDPINTIINTAAKHVGCDQELLLKTVGQSSAGGIFGGDALSNFFNWNPFSEAPTQQEYNRWVMVEFLKKATNEEIDQQEADTKLGKDLLKKLKDKCRDQGSSISPLCCSPSRNDKGVKFWINTGLSTNIDGWKTQQEIEELLKPGVKIQETRLRGR